MKTWITERLKDFAGLGLLLFMYSLGLIPAFVIEMKDQLRYLITGYPILRKGSTDPVQEIEEQYRAQHAALYREIAKQAKP